MGEINSGWGRLFGNLIKRVTVGGVTYIQNAYSTLLASGKELLFYDGSNYRKLTFANIKKAVCFLVKDSDTAVAVADGKDYFLVPESMDGLLLVAARAKNITAGTTGNHYIQVRRVRAGTPQNMLSGNGISIASGAVAGGGTPDTSYDDLATDDVIFVDVDAVHTTAALGLSVTIEFAEVA